MPQADLFTVNSASMFAKSKDLSPSDRASLRVAIATGELRARRSAGPRGSWFIERDDLLAFYASRRSRRELEPVMA